jgi:hypothetical protein
MSYVCGQSVKSCTELAPKSKRKLATCNKYKESEKGMLEDGIDMEITISKAQNIFY